VLANAPSIPLAAAAGVTLAGNVGASAVGYATIQELAPASMRSQMVGFQHFAGTVLPYRLGPWLVGFVNDQVMGDRDTIATSLFVVATPI
jgi:dipeptide/tripeptide permease